MALLTHTTSLLTALAPQLSSGDVLNALSSRRDRGQCATGGRPGQAQPGRVRLGLIWL
jgi:hypothetical protein